MDPRVEGSETSLGDLSLLSKAHRGARRRILIPNEAPAEDNQVIGSTGVSGWRSLSKAAICIEQRGLRPFIMPSGGLGDWASYEDVLIV